MASATAVSVAIRTPAAAANQSRMLSNSAIFNPMKLTPRATSHLARSGGRLQIQASASHKEKAVAGLTAAALAAALVLPDIAEAAQPGLSGSLKNFLLSIVSGGVVVTAIIGAVVAVSNFDPVKRS